MAAYFISGVDTDCGKTYVTAHLAAHLRCMGVSVITQKPVQTGCTDVAEDLVVHRHVMGCPMLPEDKEGRTCTYLFTKPASPHLAAKLDGQQIDPSAIAADTRFLEQRFDIVLVEGAGGLMVPLRKDLMTIDYVAEQKMPLILVATSHLGGINHAVLSIEACKTHGVRLHTVVFNRFPADDKVMADDAYDMIGRYAKATFPDVKYVDFRSSDSFDGLCLEK